jgi:hypothetical protein
MALKIANNEMDLDRQQNPNLRYYPNIWLGEMGKLTRNLTQWNGRRKEERIGER